MHSAAREMLEKLLATGRALCQQPDDEQTCRAALVWFQQTSKLAQLIGANWLADETAPLAASIGNKELLTAMRPIIDIVAAYLDDPDMPDPRI